MTDEDRGADKTASQQWLELSALGAAHDINQLLGVILGRIQLLRQTELATYAKDLESMESAARDAAVICQRVLTMSSQLRLEAAQAVDLTEVVRDCIERAQSQRQTSLLSQTSVCSFETEIPEDVKVRASPAALREVLLNLLANGLQAMPDGGTVVLRARRDGDRVHLRVRDAGPGMDERTLASIFEPGFTSGKPHGHGIGLPISRALVEAMGGNLSIESVPGGGTTVELVLPAASADAVAMGPFGPLSEQRVTGSRRVLVVDNEPQVCELVKTVLETDGHRVVAMTNPNDVLRSYRAGAFDVAIVDYTLPGQSGLEIVRRIRARDSRVAIALISGWGTESSLGDTVEEHGVDLFVPKPIDLPGLKKLMVKAAQVVDGRKRRADQAQA